MVVDVEAVVEEVVVVVEEEEQEALLTRSRPHELIVAVSAAPSVMDSFHVPLGFSPTRLARSCSGSSDDCGAPVSVPEVTRVAARSSQVVPSKVSAWLAGPFAFVIVTAMPAGDVSTTFSAAAELLTIVVCNVADSRKHPGVVTASDETLVPGWGTAVDVEFVADVFAPLGAVAHVDSVSDQPASCAEGLSCR